MDDDYYINDKANDIVGRWLDDAVDAADDEAEAEAEAES